MYTNEFLTGEEIDKLAGIKKRKHRTCKLCKRKFLPREWHHEFCFRCYRILNDPDAVFEEFVRRPKSAITAIDQSKPHHSRFTILNRDRFKCFYCGRTPSEDGVKLHVDHVIPVLYGGKSVAGNLLTSCEDCNLGKKASRLADERGVLAAISARNAEFCIPDDFIIHGNR